MTPPASGTRAQETAPTNAAPETAQRRHILDAALALMSEHGAHSTSMRQLARACDLNVATLYHYFPSKSELFRAVVADRRYFDQMEAAPPPVDPTAPLVARLTDLVTQIWSAALTEQAIIRLILGESLRGDEVARATINEITGALETTFSRWLDEIAPDLPADRAVTARVLRGQLFAFLIEILSIDPDDRRTHVAQHAADVAALVSGERPAERP